MKINVTYEITDEMLATLFSDMLSGSDYWAELGARYPKGYKSDECLEDKLVSWVNDGKTFMIVNIDDYDDEEEPIEYPINLQTIERGLQVMAKVFPDHLNNLFSENDDATTGDVFLQCCCFPDEIEKDNDLIYG